MSLELTFTPEYTSYGHEEQPIHVLATLKASKAPGSTGPRAPVHLAWAVDCSGSMKSDGKMETVKETLKYAIAQLKPQDTLSLVTFADEARVVLPLTRMDESGKSFARSLVSGLIPSGTTHLYAGLSKAVAVLKALNGDGLASVFMFTDGQPSDKESPTSRFDAQLDNIRVSTFGFGGDVDGQLLKDLASRGKGSYYFIGSTNEIAPAFGESLGGIMATLAKNIKIALSGQGFVDVVTTTGVVTKPSAIQFSDAWTVDFPDLEYEERRDFIIKLTLPAAPGDTARQLVFTAAVVWFNLTSKTDETIDWTICEVSRVEKPSASPAVQREFKLQHIRIDATRLLDKVQALSDANDFDQAQVLIRAFILERLHDYKTEPFIKALHDDFAKVLQSTQNKAAYQHGGSQSLHSLSSAHSGQRSGAAYETSARSQMSLAIQASSSSKPTHSKSDGNNQASSFSLPVMAKKR